MVDYGYNPSKVPLNMEEVLLRVKPEEIFGLFIKEPIIWEERVYYTAPYRQDSTPGCYFEMTEEGLSFVDFATKPPSLTCFNFCKKCLETDLFSEALEYINKELKLGLGYTSQIPSKKPILNHVTIEKPKLKIKRDILISPRDFNNKDRDFWVPYGIEKNQLIRDGVYPIKGYSSISKNGSVFSIFPMDIMYAYTEFSEKKKKIYRPYGNKLEKWFTNCGANDIGGLKSIDKKSNHLVITKSYKDWRVGKNYSLNLIWFQNEGMIPSLTLLDEVLKPFKYIYVWFDNDPTGITMSSSLLQILSNRYKNKIIRNILIPKKHLLEKDVTDLSDYRKTYGEIQTQNFINQLNLIL